jgi:hypothetical protein
LGTLIEETRARRHPMERKSWFYRRFLNSKFTTVCLNAVLVLLAIWIFTQIAWVFKPVGAFVGIVAPPFILAGVLFYLLNPLVNFLQKHGVKRLLAIALVFIVVIGLWYWPLSKWCRRSNNNSTTSSNITRNTGKALPIG